jgi:ABC-2 type transport system permease protein
MYKVLVILQKEWLEIKQQRGLLLSVLLPPLLLTLLPLGVAYGLTQTPPQELNTNVPSSIISPALAGLSKIELGQAIIGQQFSILFFLLPLIIPSVIAAYSVVGEKTNKTLEPLLATPMRTWELLLGKSLAALIPAVALTWLCGAIFIAGIARVAVSGRVFAAIISPGWLVILVLCTPLLALIAIAAMVVVSSRVSDPRTAQQLTGVVIIPVLLVFFGQLTGVLVLNPALALGAAGVLVVCAALAIWIATRMFQREAILTRWR